MTAHEIDGAARRLGELRSQTLEDAVLAAACFGLALGATWYRPSLAIPLTVGAMVMAVLACRAFVKRFWLVEELAVDRDAYRIPAVHDFGLRTASLEHRREIAQTVRRALVGSAGEAAERMEVAGPDLVLLIAALENEKVDWEPQAVVALDQWLADPAGSFRDPSLPAVEMRSRVRSVLAGLGSARAAQ